VTSSAARCAAVSLAAATAVCVANALAIVSLSLPPAASAAVTLSDT